MVKDLLTLHIDLIGGEQSVKAMTVSARVLERPESSWVIHGNGPAFQSLKRVIGEVCKTDIPLLLVGESGTGKDVYARFIHQGSNRAGYPLRKLSCTLVDSEHLLLQLRDCSANGDGTLFVDGVDELDLLCQRALLSFLPDGDHGSADGKIRARLICSTSRNLNEEVMEGRFRRELYFRINGVCLSLPPLRERKEDIPELLEFLLAKHSNQLSKIRPVVSPEAINILSTYAWPGNVRELENVAKKIVALGDADLAVSDLRLGVQGNKSESDDTRLSSFKATARAASRRAEHELILKALKQTRWNRKRAAQELQISYKSLLHKIKQIGVQFGPE